MTTEQVRSFLHGGYFSNRLREPVRDGIFIVGDAAGQCLPLTGEGIRPPIVFGQRCGDLLQEGLDGERSTTDAATRYRAMVRRYRVHYALLRALQRGLPRLPDAPMAAFLSLLARPGVADWFLDRYVRLLAPRPPLSSRAGAGAGTLRPLSDPVQP